MHFSQETTDYRPITASLSADGKLLASSAFEFDVNSRESYAGIRVWGVGPDGLGLLKKVKIQTKRSSDSDKWHALAWSPRASYLAARSNEVLITLSDPLGEARERMIVHPSLLKGEVNGMGRLPGSGLKHNITGVAFSPDEKVMAVAFWNMGVHIFTLPECHRQAVLPFDEPIESWEWIPEHPGWASPPVSFNGDGSLLATFQKHDGRRGRDRGEAGTTYSVKFWNTSSWKESGTVPPNSTERRNQELHAVGFLPGSPVYATASVDKTLLMTLWDARTAAATGSIRPFLLPNKGAAISISANGKAALFNQGEGGLQVWDIGSGRPIARIDDERSHDPRNAVLSADARLVATGYPDGEVALWDVSAPVRRVSLGGMLAESRAATKVHERQNAFRNQKAPPVTKRLFDQIRVGMTSLEVQKLLGGQPTKVETEVERIADRSGGRLRGVTLITRYTEYYPAQGRPGAYIVLVFRGRGNGPPLVDRRTAPGNLPVRWVKLARDGEGHPGS